MKLNNYVILFTLCLVSCSTNKDTGSPDDLLYGGQDYIDGFVSRINARWYRGAERFALKDIEGKTEPHYFFDVASKFNFKDKSLNVVIETPSNSDDDYQLDISSGQIYYHHKYCAQRDIADKFEGRVHRPIFSTGYVPRVLDQLNQPQKILVFGGDKYINEYYKTNYFGVRVVGGFIEQICPLGECMSQKEWVSRLVLVAVFRGDKDYKNVVDLLDLQNIVDWESVKAFIRNQHGVNKVSKQKYQAYRSGANISPSQALNFLESNSTIFTINKLKQMRLSCYKLYDFLWTNVGDTNLYSDKKKVSFTKRFQYYFKKYQQQFSTCSKYIYPANINDDAQRHWFFTYLTGFSNLVESGYYFSCNSQTWKFNPYVRKNIRLVPFKDQLRGCSERAIDRAFDLIPNYVEALYKSGLTTFRFIDYDRSARGTHSKVYSWVKMNNKRMACEEEQIKQSLFPKDVRWVKRYNGK